MRQIERGINQTDECEELYVLLDCQNENATNQKRREKRSADWPEKGTTFIKSKEKKSHLRTCRQGLAIFPDNL